MIWHGTDVLIAGTLAWKEAQIKNLYRNESVLDRDEYRFRPIAHVQLLGDMIHVISDRELAYLQRIRYFLVGEPLCHQFEYLTLTVAQSGRHLITGKSLRDATRKRCCPPRTDRMARTISSAGASLCR